MKQGYTSIHFWESDYLSKDLTIALIMCDKVHNKVYISYFDEIRFDINSVIELTAIFRIKNFKNKPPRRNEGVNQNQLL